MIDIENIIICKYGISQCQFAVLMLTDSTFTLSNSWSIFTNIIENIKQAMLILLHHEYEKYAYLLYNGSVYIYKYCKIIIKYGYFKEAINYLSFCILSIEAVIDLVADIKMLNWRMLLYTTAIDCYEYINDYKNAHNIMLKAKTQVIQLKEWEEIDPPVPIQTQQTIQQMLSYLDILDHKYQLILSNDINIQTLSLDINKKIAIILEVLSKKNVDIIHAFTKVKNIPNEHEKELQLLSEIEILLFNIERKSNDENQKKK